MDRAFLRVPSRSTHTNRRKFLAFLSAGLGLSLAQACAAPSPSPPTAPQPAPTTPPAAAKPTVAPPPAAKPTTAPPAAAKAPTAAPPKVQSLVKLSMTSVAPVFWQAPLFLGISKGIFAEQGLDFSVQTFESSTTVAQSLIGGQVDAGSYNTGGQLAAIAKGATIKIIGSANPGMAFAIGSKKQFSKLQDLYGHAFATSGPGTFYDIVMRALLKKEGLDPSKIEFVNIGGNTATVQALLAGKVDATGIGLENVPMLESAGADAKVLVYIDEQLPEFVSGTIAVGNKLIAEQPDRVVALMAGCLNAVRYARTHKQDVVEQEVKRLAMEERIAAASHEQFVKRVWRPNLELPKESIMYMQQMNVEIGQQDNLLPFERVADWTFLERALAKVGKISG